MRDTNTHYGNQVIMKIRLKILLAILLFACLTSCVRDVILDAREEPQVVVECILTNSDIQELRLNFTKGASKEEAAPLTEATATLIDLTAKKEVGQFIRKGGDLWTLDYSPMPYHEYRIEVQVPGYDLIYAEDTMPGQVKCYYAMQRGYPSTDLTHYDFAFDDWKIMTALNSGVTQRYRDKTQKLNYLRGSVYLLYDVPHPFLIYGMNYNPVTEDYEMVKQLCTDHAAVSSSTLSGGTYVPPSIIEELPRVQLHPYLEGTPLHNRYLIFPKKSDEVQKFFILSGSFAGEWSPQSYDDYHEGKSKGYLVFVSMSDNYKRYLDDAIRLQILNEYGDLTRIYVRDNMYSNINGGIGLFAATSEERGDWARIYMNLDAWEMFWSKYEEDPKQFYDKYGYWRYYVNDREGLEHLVESGRLTEDEFARIG